MSNNTTDVIFKSLDELYISGDYDAVISKILENKAKISPGIFHYNLGTAYLKKGELAVARFHLEKSFSKGYVTPQLSKNLSTTKNRLNVEEIESSSSFSDKLIDYSTLIPKEGFYSMSLIVILLGLLLLRLKKVKINWLPYFVGFALIFVFIGFYSSNNFQTAYVLKNSKIFEGPSESFDVSQEVPGGVKVIIEKKNSKWLFIKSPVHLSGWVKREVLGIL